MKPTASPEPQRLLVLQELSRIVDGRPAVLGKNLQLKLLERQSLRQQGQFGLKAQSDLIRL